MHTKVKTYVYESLNLRIQKLKLKHEFKMLSMSLGNQNLSISLLESETYYVFDDFFDSRHGQDEYERDESCVATRRRYVWNLL